MYKIKNSWTYKHIQLVIILGLVTGISIKSLQIGSLISEVFAAGEEVTYIKEVPKICDLDCLIEQKTQERFQANLDTYMEQSRLDAIVDVRDILLSKINESPYIDYKDLEAKYGY